MLNIKHIYKIEQHGESYSLNLQFNFKAKVSSDMCIFTLKQLISSYHKQSSPVYCAFLDASKAFDRVNHYILFKKLIERNMPTCFVRILYY